MISAQYLQVNQFIRHIYIRFKLNSCVCHVLDVSIADATSKTKIDFVSLAIVRNSMGANQMHDVILKSIDRNISIVEAAVTCIERPLTTFVFHPKILGHFISFVYPTFASNDGSI